MKSQSLINKLKQNLHFRTPSIISCLLLVAILFYSCDSDDGSPVEEFNASIIDTEQEIVELDDTTENINEIIESAYLEVATEDFFKSSDYKNDKDKRFLSSCVVISKELMDGYSEIVLDYGDGCTTKKQHEAKGKIIIHVQASPESKTVNMTYTFDNFYINDKKIEGTVEKERIKSNENGNPQSQISRNIKIIWEDDTYSSIQGQRTREWIDGNDNDQWGDNVFSITGNWTITKRDGRVSTSSIIEPLIRMLACRFTVSGIIEIETADKTSQLNFGDGECDEMATITKNGNSYEVHIRRKKGN